MRTRLIAAIALALAACSRETAKNAAEETRERARSAVQKVADVFEADSPYDGRPSDRAAREKERFDQQWRDLQTFRAQEEQKARQQQPPQGAPAGFQFVPLGKETFEGLDADALNASPAGAPINGDVSGPSVLRAQVYLDRLRFSVGAIDGRWGRNSAITVWWYQRARGVNATGDLDEATFRLLAGEAGFAPVVRSYSVTADDLDGPFVKIPDDVYEQEKLKCLCYEDAKELLAERFHADRDFLDVLNPGRDWRDLKAGDTIVVPNVREALTAENADVARIVVSIRGNSLDAYDAAGNVLFHAPTTVGSKFDPSPRETLRVARIAPDPYFHYNPKLYYEVPDTDPDAHLAPGPNSPVGVVWVALTKPHYGIHGTSEPESIGYASSPGCVRLTNWDADELRRRVKKGVEVRFVDSRKGSGS